MPAGLFSNTKFTMNKNEKKTNATIVAGNPPAWLLEKALGCGEGLFFFKKEEDALPKWVAVYSNNVLDDDLPPDIISADSHRKFVEMVDNGVTPPPDIWVWHEKDWEFGKGEWVALDEQEGGIVFSIAGGVVKEGFEDLAKALDMLEGKALSHGMPVWSIKREDEDPKIITGHITAEVSVLPVSVAANKLTRGGYHYLKDEGGIMAIASNKKQELAEQGVPTGLLDELEKTNADKAKAVVDTEMEFKQAEEEPAVENTVKEEETVVEAPPAPQEEQEFVKRAEVEEALVAVNSVLASINTVLENVSKRLVEIEDRENARKEVEARNTPLASLASLIGFDAKSVVGNDAAKIDGRSALAKDGPPTPPEQKKGLFWESWVE